jgi:hypothetical protein
MGSKLRSFIAVAATLKGGVVGLNDKTLESPFLPQGLPLTSVA